MEDYADYFSGYLPGADYKINIRNSGRQEAPVYIEPGVASANFSLSYPDPGDDLTLSLIKPTGEAVTGGNGSTIELITSPGAKTFKVTNPGPGTWKMVLSAGTVATGSANLVAQIRHEGAGLFAWTDNEEVTYAPEAVRVHARPTYDGSNAPAGTYTVTATATDTSGLSATSAPLTITVQPVVACDLIISEFRFRGPASQLDKFVELYNNTDFTVTVSTTDGSGGWSLVGSDGSVRFTIPNGTVIPARGHFMGVNAAAYSLGAYAPADAEWLNDIADGAGAALFSSSSPSDFTAAYRLDAVGFASVADATFREGAGLQPAAGVSANNNFSFMRRLNSTTPADALVTRLRFRVTDMTTYPVGSGVADMRLRSSDAVQVTRTDGSVAAVQAMTLQTPPAQPNGGGFNSTVSVGTITLAEPLQPGASVHIQFLLGLQSTGSFRFFINIEAWQ